MWYFWTTFVLIWATFYSHIWSHWGEPQVCRTFTLFAFNQGARVEGLYLPNFKTKLVIALYTLSLLFCKLMNTTAYHLGRYEPSSPISCHTCQFNTTMDSALGYSRFALCSYVPVDLNALGLNA